MKGMGNVRAVKGKGLFFWEAGVTGTNALPAALVSLAGLKSPSLPTACLEKSAFLFVAVVVQSVTKLPLLMVLLLVLLLVVVEGERQGVVVRTRVEGEVVEGLMTRVVGLKVRGLRVLMILGVRGLENRGGQERIMWGEVRVTMRREKGGGMGRATLRTLGFSWRASQSSPQTYPFHWARVTMIHLGSILA